MYTDCNYPQAEVQFLKAGPQGTDFEVQSLSRTERREECNCVKENLF